jgi:hypothetical protein
MLPVVTKFSGEVFDDYPSESRSIVYPFTRAHVDLLLKENTAQAKIEVSIPRISKRLWRLGRTTIQMGRITPVMKPSRNERIPFTRSYFCRIHEGVELTDTGRGPALHFISPSLFFLVELT